MKQIQILDPQTINKIAAGEVIDRPASIVKELIENSLDAQASQINIEIEDGGKKLIKITDNGHGIEKENLSLAPLRHATSKINKIEDLYSIDSFGFRGEALASICHVSKLQIISKTADAQAYTIQIFEKDISNPEISVHNQGTSVKVRDLFQNLPVRKKFLKSSATEFAYIFDIVLQFSLIHPQISFRLLNNGKELLNTTGITDPKYLLISLLGKELKNNLIKLEHQEGYYKLNGYISKPTFLYPNRSKQYIAVNKRIVKNPIIQKAISEAYSDLIPNRKHPLILLNLDITKSNIDVNIHPQKLNIKFLNQNQLYNTIYTTLKSQIHTQEFKSTFQVSYQPLSNSNYSNTTNYQNSAPLYSKEGIKQEDIMSVKNLYSNQKPFSQDLLKIDYFQILNSYLVIKSENELLILDQHAAHERILYEKLKKSQSTKKERQQLLIAETVKLDPGHYHLFIQNNHLFKELNFEIDDFGNNQIIIREIPLYFTETDMNSFIISILDQIKTMPEISANTLNLQSKEKLQMSACKSAIKAGQKMSAPEIEQLVRDLIKTPNNYTCPHGRPLFIKIDKNQLEKFFLRK